MVDVIGYIKIHTETNTVFYHIILKNRLSDCVINRNRELVTLSQCEVHLQYRKGGIGGEQIIINFLNGTESLREPRYKAINNCFVEQYLPIPEGFDFLSRGINLLEKIHYSYKKNPQKFINDEQFQKMINFYFDKNISGKDWKKKNCEVCNNGHLYCDVCKKYTWDKKEEGDYETNEFASVV